MYTTGTNFRTDQASRQTGYANNRVTSAIQQASMKTGVDFDYLVKQAKVESSLNPNAKARTSSATGLYQFIEQTWLHMMKDHGDEHGYGKYADAIHQSRDGTYHVSNRSMRNQILNMRKDPQASSLMAAELATENNDYLQQATGEQPGQTDLYLAHFMGAAGAANFLNSMKKNPWAPAASLFPDAARSNRSVFYADGRPLSLQQIYNRFENKFQGGDSSPVQTAKLNIYNNDDGYKPGKATLSLYADGSPAPADLQEEVSTWSRPNSIAQRIAANTRSKSIEAFTATEPNPASAHENNGMGGMGFLRNPVEIMFMAQANTNAFAHDDDARYNS